MKPQKIVTTDENCDKLVKKLRISTVNARSIKSKENLISYEHTVFRPTTCLTLTPLVIVIGMAIILSLLL